MTMSYIRTPIVRIHTHFVKDTYTYILFSFTSNFDFSFPCRVMTPKKRILYDQECRERFLSPIHQTHEWARSHSLFYLEFVNPVTEHVSSPPDDIRAICKGWCRLDDHARRDNSVHKTLLLSIEDGETLKYSTTSDLRSLIRKISLGEDRWVGGSIGDLLPF